MPPPRRYTSVKKRILDAPGRVRRPAGPPPEPLEHTITRRSGAVENCACILGEDHAEGGDA